MKHRSKEKELMDLGSPFHTHEEYVDCLKILFKVNRLLGFFKQTVQVLKRFSKDASLIDVGCGGGLFLLNLSNYYPKMRLLGMDVSAVAIECAEQERVRWKPAPSVSNVSFQVQPTLQLALPVQSIDLVLTTLVCHHMDDADLVVFLKTAYQAAREAVIINDLHRHAIAYWLYQRISPWLFRNRLITHDGLISIRRGFTRAEWHHLLKQANITHYEIKWCFPFRWRVILWKN